MPLVSHDAECCKTEFNGSLTIHGNPLVVRSIIGCTFKVHQNIRFLLFDARYHLFIQHFQLQHKVHVKQCINSKPGLNETPNTVYSL